MHGIHVFTIYACCMHAFSLLHLYPINITKELIQVDNAIHVECSVEERLRVGCIQDNPGILMHQDRNSQRFDLTQAHKQFLSHTHTKYVNAGKFYLQSAAEGVE